MVLDAVSNFVRGNTDASVDSTQTTVSVDDASIFPDPATDGEYNVVIWDVDSHPRPDQDPAVEILRVTAIDTTNDDLTVTRGQETTSGASHPSGSAIHLSPTAKMFGDIESTFAEFYDDANQELTADVNNGSVSTDEATIENVQLTQDNIDNLTDHNGDRVIVDGWQTIFDMTEAVDVIGGSVTGYFVTGFRITWADDSTDTIGGGNSLSLTWASIAEDAGSTTAHAHRFSAQAVPPIKNVKKLEFEASQGTRKVETYGWEVIST